MTFRLCLSGEKGCARQIQRKRKPGLRLTGMKGTNASALDIAQRGRARRLLPGVAGLRKPSSQQHVRRRRQIKHAKLSRKCDSWIQLFMERQIISGRDKEPSQISATTNALSSKTSRAPSCRKDLRGWERIERRAIRCWSVSSGRPAPFARTASSN